MNTAPQTAGNGSAAPVTPATTQTQEGPALLYELLDRRSARFTLGLEPGIADQKALEDAWDIAQSAAAAGLAPNDDEAYARILIGRALGIPAMASIQGIALIESKNPDGSRRTTPCMYAKLKLALLQSRKDIIEYIRPLELTNATATWIGKRVDDPEPFKYTFTIEDAKTAGLVGRGDGKTNSAGVQMGNYDRHPGPMLQWRACGRLCDILGADILTGIATREDMEDENTLAKLLEKETRLGQAAAAGRGELPDVPPPPQAKGAAAPPPAQGGGVAPAAATPAASAPAGRDFRKETDALKKQLDDAIKAQNKAKVKAATDAYQAFKADAPAEFVEEFQRYYAEEIGKARKAQHPAGASTAAPPVPAQQPAASQPAQAAPAQTPAAPTQAPGKSPYLPPDQRGDSYDGPDTPFE